MITMKLSVKCHRIDPDTRLVFLSECLRCFAADDYTVLVGSVVLLKNVRRSFGENGFTKVGIRYQVQLIARVEGN